MKKRWVAQLPGGTFLRTGQYYGGPDPTEDLDKAKVFHVRQAVVTKKHPKVVWR